MSSDASPYVLGHSQEELARLQRQAEFFAEATTDILTRAGIAKGMRVLDVGCGVGDVSLIAADLVGPTGSVVGIDQSEDALAVARARTVATDRPWVSFERSDVNEFEGGGAYDAVVGRFILLHLTDPVETLRRLTSQLRPDCVVSFIEMDIGTATAVPGFQLFDDCMGWITELYRRSGFEPNMGSKLYGVFRAAGLTPDLTGSCRIEAGPAAAAHDYITDSIRSIMPHLARHGIASPERIMIETLRERLRQDAISGDHCFIFPRFIGAWARCPT
jgi:ubiquinone/menaquinone biosynthesis C-methylase UbiE